MAHHNHQPLAFSDTVLHVLPPAAAAVLSHVPVNTQEAVRHHSKVATLACTVKRLREWELASTQDVGIAVAGEAQALDAVTQFATGRPSLQQLDARQLALEQQMLALGSVVAHGVGPAAVYGEAPAWAVAMQNKLEEIGARLAAVAAKTDTVASKTAALETELAANSASVAALGAKTAALETQLAANSASVTALGAKTDAVQSTVQEIRSQTNIAQLRHRNAYVRKAEHIVQPLPAADGVVPAGFPMPCKVKQLLCLEAPAIKQLLTAYNIEHRPTAPRQQLLDQLTEHLGLIML